MQDTRPRRPSPLFPLSALALMLGLTVLVLYQIAQELLPSA
jgi:hypothetical protein